MSAAQSRLPLLIDVFQEKAQEAQALPELTPLELVEAILLEFHELEYLSDAPQQYQLLRATDQTPLEPDQPLGHQLGQETHLIMVENETDPPGGTRRPALPVYLREQASGRVYKLHWQPAIIGRPDKNQPRDDWVAVNLEPYKTGLRVSRRHAEISEENGRYLIRGLSRNPTTIRRENDEEIDVTAEKLPLQDGDVIFLDRSNIALKFIIRPENGASAA